MFINMSTSGGANAMNIKSLNPDANTKAVYPGAGSANADFYGHLRGDVEINDNDDDDDDIDIPGDLMRYDNKMSYQELQAAINKRRKDNIASAAGNYVSEDSNID